VLDKFFCTQKIFFDTDKLFFHSIKNFAKDKIACLYQNTYGVRVSEDRREKL